MLEEKKESYKALGGSVLFHLLIIIIAAFSGFFAFAKQQSEPQPVEVEMYDAGDTGSAGGGSAPPAANVASVDDISLDDKNKKEEQQEAPKDAATNSNYQNTLQGKLGGRGGTGGGEDIGNGDKKGPGTGDEGGGVQKKAEPPPPPPPPPPPEPAKPERVKASLRSEAVAVYPEDLIDDDVEGVVQVRILVAEDGSIESASVVSSSGYDEMDEAALQAAYKFRFNAGTQKGYFTKTFRFNLNN